MDDQTTQQLTMLVQQMLQVLQSSGGAGDGMDDDDMDDDELSPMDKKAMKKKAYMSKMGDGADVDESDEDEDEDEDEDMDESGDDFSMDEDEDEEEMGGSASLHDRISRLESHTGLRKFAKSASVPAITRIDYLEREMLGEEYEGTALQRVEQLEAVVLGKSADAPPDVIPIDELIKSAVNTAVEKAVRHVTRQQRSGSDELPDVRAMRKAARVGRSRRQASSVRGEEDLRKAAQEWGIDGDLDEPVGFGDALMALYGATANSFTANVPNE